MRVGLVVVLVFLVVLVEEKSEREGLELRLVGTMEWSQRLSMWEARMGRYQALQLPQVAHLYFQQQIGGWFVSGRMFWHSRVSQVLTTTVAVAAKLGAIGSGSIVQLELRSCRRPSAGNSGIVTPLDSSLHQLPGDCVEKQWISTLNLRYYCSTLR